MAEEQTNFSLEMVSTPAEPLPHVCHAGPKFGISKFMCMRFVQQSGMLLLAAALSFGSYYLVSHYVLKSVRVVGVSMLPTLHENGKYLLNIWALHQRPPQPNDIVVIRDPEDNGLSVKRVIAVAGESVHFKNGKVYVNGKQLSEPYLPPHTRTFTYSFIHEQFITCGKDQYFVLGDNRPRSIDSRAYGPVPRANVLGLVQIR